MGGIALPALDIKPPQQQEDSTQQFMRLKSLLGQQQLQQQQIQGSQLANQQAQMDVDSQKALQKAYMEAQGDPDKTTKLAAQYGAKPQALLQWQNAVLDQKTKTIDLVSKQGTLAKTQADLMQGAHDAVMAADPKDRPLVYQQQRQQLMQQGVDASQTPLQYPGDDQFKFMGIAVKAHSQQVEEALKQAETAQKGTDAELGQNKLDIIRQYKANPQLLAGQVNAAAPPNKYGDLNRRTMQAVQLAMSTGDVDAAKAAIKQASEEVGGIEKEVNPQVQQGKINVAVAEGKARQLVQGMAEPVYAMDASGQKTLMSKTAALQGGAKVILPVNEKQVGEDIQLNNRLGDIRQKVTQYEQALKTNLSDKDKGNIAGLLGTKGKVGLFGTEIPIDRLNAALQSENLKDLSQQGRTALIAYRNVREAMLGYQKVLSGSARSSDRMFEVNEQTMPDPSISDAAFAAQSIGAFKQNLHVIGQGLPRIPGVKTPDEIEQEVSQPTNQPKDFFSQFGGKQR